MAVHCKYFHTCSRSFSQSITESAVHFIVWTKKGVKPKPQAPAEKKVGWVCKICGYVYEGEELPPDFVCPLCKHGAADFEKLQ